MKRLVATIVVLSSAPVYFLFTPVASASEVVTVCKPVTSTNIVRDAAAHAGAYEDGFGEGRLSASRGETYKPRSVGGEFARGFDDGYSGRRFTGQEYAVRDRVESYTTQQCQNVQTNNPNVNQQVRPGYPTGPSVNQQVRPGYPTGSYQPVSPGYPTGSYQPVSPGYPTGSYQPVSPGYPTGSYQPVSPGYPTGSYQPVSPGYPTQPNVIPW